MSDYVPQVSEELLAGFLDEAPEYLTILDEGLMAFESKAGEGVFSLDDPEDKTRMNEMFRAAHSLKGLGAAMGFDKIRDLTHVMENLFDQIRMGKRGLDPASIQTLFGVFDRLRELVKELSEPPAQPVDIQDALAQLHAILDTSAAPAPSAASEPAVAQPVSSAPMPSAPLPVMKPAVLENAPSAVSGNGVLDNPELANLFVETTVDALDEINQGLLKLEAHPNDAELINTVFRCAHNIKGATGAAGCMALYHLTHDMETALDLVRSGRLVLDESLSTAIFAVVDRLRADIGLVRDGRLSELTVEGTVGVFEQWLTARTQNQAGKQEPHVAAPEAGATTMTAEHVEIEPACASTEDVETFCIEVGFPKDFAEAEIQAYLIHGKLKDIGDLVSTEPDVEKLDGSASLDRITYELRTSAAATEIEKLVRTYAVESVKVTNADGASAPPPSEPAALPATIVSMDPAVVPCEKKIQSQSPAIRPALAKANTKDSAAATPNSAANASAQPKVGETIRVDLERLDQLMNLGGELVINKARLSQIQGRFDPLFQGQNVGYVMEGVNDRFSRLQMSFAKLADFPADKRVLSDLSETILLLSHDFDAVRSLIRRVYDCRGAMNDFSEAMHSLGRVSEGIQKRIMDTRMVAVGPLFQRFRRVVRDIAKSTGKTVELVLHGEATELDKRMIDELGDPLTHMVRNSVDHGIESPEERVKAGKPAIAQVILNAYHRGRHICIEVKDDGKGINIERVKQKIVERELATSAEVERMTEKEIAQYVFRPGFSTAEQVTDLSGRGMGMDIVLTKIESLNGMVDVDSVTGKGTTVTIKLPLTMAIITAMLARIGRGVYAIPLEAVAEIITVSQSSISHVQRRRVVRVRDRVIPVALLEQIFRARDGELRTRRRGESQVTLMILNLQEERVGLVVDDLIGQEDVVIKSISENYRNVPGVAGASIMGDGSVALILDVASMFSMLASRSDNEVLADWQEDASSVTACEQANSDAIAVVPSSPPSADKEEMQAHALTA